MANVSNAIRANSTTESIVNIQSNGHNVQNELQPQSFSSELSSPVHINYDLIYNALDERKIRNVIKTQDSFTNKWSDEIEADIEHIYGIPIEFQTAVKTLATRDPTTRGVVCLPEQPGPNVMKQLNAGVNELIKAYSTNHASEIEKTPDNAYSEMIRKCFSSGAASVSLQRSSTANNFKLKIRVDDKLARYIAAYTDINQLDKATFLLKNVKSIESIKLIVETEFIKSVESFIDVYRVKVGDDVTKLRLTPGYQALKAVWTHYTTMINIHMHIREHMTVNLKIPDDELNRKLKKFVVTDLAAKWAKGLSDQIVYAIQQERLDNDILSGIDSDVTFENTFEEVTGQNTVDTFAELQAMFTEKNLEKIPVDNAVVNMILSDLTPFERPNDTPINKAGYVNLALQDLDKITPDQLANQLNSFELFRQLNGDYTRDSYGNVLSSEAGKIKAVDAVTQCIAAIPDVALETDKKMNDYFKNTLQPHITDGKLYQLFNLWPALPAKTKGDFIEFIDTYKSDWHATFSYQIAQCWGQNFNAPFENIQSNVMQQAIRELLQDIKEEFTKEKTMQDFDVIRNIINTNYLSFKEILQTSMRASNKPELLDEQLTSIKRMLEPGGIPTETQFDVAGSAKWTGIGLAAIGIIVFFLYSLCCVSRVSTLTQRKILSNAFSQQIEKNINEIATYSFTTYLRESGDTMNWMTDVKLSVQALKTFLVGDDSTTDGKLIGPNRLQLSTVCDNFFDTNRDCDIQRFPEIKIRIKSEITKSTNAKRLLLLYINFVLFCLKKIHTHEYTVQKSYLTEEGALGKRSFADLTFDKFFNCDHKETPFNPNVQERAIRDSLTYASEQTLKIGSDARSRSRKPNASGQTRSRSPSRAGKSIYSP